MGRSRYLVQVVDCRGAPDSFEENFRLLTVVDETQYEVAECKWQSPGFHDLLL